MACGDLLAFLQLPKILCKYKGELVGAQSNALVCGSREGMQGGHAAEGRNDR